jgi:hypothetical protein
MSGLVLPLGHPRMQAVFGIQCAAAGTGLAVIAGPYGVAEIAAGGALHRRRSTPTASFGDIAKREIQKNDRE